MNKEELNFNNISRLEFLSKESNPLAIQLILPNFRRLFKKGGTIKIKKENVGSFTRYCGGNVTSECIRRGKNSSDPKIRKKATFAANARTFKHKFGGVLLRYDINKLNQLLNNLRLNE